MAGALLSIPSVTSAQGASTTVTTQTTTPSTLGQGSVTFLKNPLKVTSITDFIKALLDTVIKIAIPIIALAIIYSGFLFVSARGNGEKLETAKRTFIYTLAGAAILLGAWALATIVSDTVSAIVA
jgi:hypothetical protein